MYVLERKVPRAAGKFPRRLWQQYAVCGRRGPLERVRLGLGGTAEWRIRKIVAVSIVSDRAA